MHGLSAHWRQARARVYLMLCRPVLVAVDHCYVILLRRLLSVCLFLGLLFLFVPSIISKHPLSASGQLHSRG